MESFIGLDPVTWQQFLYSGLNPTRDTKKALDMYNKDREEIDSRSVAWYENHTAAGEQALTAWRRQRLRYGLPDFAPEKHAALLAERSRAARVTARKPGTSPRPHRLAIDPTLWKMSKSCAYVNETRYRVIALTDEGLLNCEVIRGHRYFTQKELDRYLASLSK